MPAVFIGVCAISTALVGARWAFEAAIFSWLQPIVASVLPVIAWYCFAKGHGRSRYSLLHLLGPVAILLCVFDYVFGREAIDIILMALYVVYGIALVRASFTVPEAVRLGDVVRVRLAERIAGVMLLVSTVIDGAVSVDFLVYGGEHALGIVSFSYLVFMPVMVMAVITVGCSTEPEAIFNSRQTSLDSHTAQRENFARKTNQLSELDAKSIVDSIEALMADTELFRDPNLSLGRLARKLGIPARQVSMAVNQVCGNNISKVLNEYRINHAKQLLAHSEDSITEIYLNSGFQTKSNFNREFLRITGQTPSAYRQSVL